jgi:MFS family permease
MTTTAADSAPSGVARKDFRWYLVSQTTAAFGSVFTGAATSVVAVQVLRASPADIGLLVGSATLPALVLGPFAGVLADVVRRPRRVLIAGDLLNAVVIAALAVGLLTGTATLGWLVVLNVLLGATNTVTHTVYFAHLNALGVDGLARSRANLQRNEYLAAGFAGSSAAPTVAAFGGPTAYLLDAVARLVSAGALTAIAAPDRNPAHGDDPDRKPFRAALVEGLRVIRESPAIRRITVAAFLIQFGFDGGATLYALFVLRTLDVPVYLFGVPSLAALLLGAAGSVLAPKLLDRGWNSRRLMVVGYLGIAVFGLAVPLAGGPLWLAVAVVAASLAARSMAGAISNIGLVGVISEEIGDDVFGRVSATLDTAITAGGLLAAGAAGWLGSVLDVRTAMIVFALVVIIAVTLVFPLARTKEAS